MFDPSPTELTPILLAPWGRNGSTALMRLLASSNEVAAPTIYPYEQYRLSAMLRAVQLLHGRFDMPRHGWGNDSLFEDAWEDCLKPLPYEDPGLVERDTFLQQTFLGLWNGFCTAVQQTREARDLRPARYYAEKSEPRLAETICGHVDCRLIFVIRDPRDVLLSSKNFNQKRNDFKYGWQEDADVPGLISWQIDRVREDLARFDRLCANGVSGRLLRYEDMIGNTNAFVGDLQDWLEIELDVAALSAEAKEHGARHFTSREPSKSVERWREEMPRELARLYEGAADDLLDRFGYGR